MLLSLSIKDNDEEQRDKHYILFAQGQNDTVHTMENDWVLLVSNIMNHHVGKYIFTILLVKCIKADIEVSQCVDHNYYSNEPLILTTPKTNTDIRKMKVCYPS